MHKLIIVIGGFLFPVCLAAQHIEKEDSTQGAFLQTVVVTGDNADADFHGRRYDGQARTERLLDNIAGISLISRGNFGQEPVMRGMSDGQINITINNMHLFGACTDRMDPVTSYVEPNNMKSLQVTSGPGPGTNGTSIGGGMNFDLRRAKLSNPEKWSGSVGTGFETNAAARQFLGNIQYKAERFAFSLDGIYRKAEDYTPGGNRNENIAHYGQEMGENGFSVDGKGRINFSQYQKWNAHANALYQLNKHQSLVADYLQDDGKNIGYPALTMDVAFARTKAGSISHEYRDADRALYYWETRVYYNDVNHAMDNSKRLASGMSMDMNMDMLMDMRGNSRTGGAYTQLYWKASAAQLIRTKLETYYNRWHADMTMYPDSGGAMSMPMPMLRIPDVQRTVGGLDISDEIRLGDLWRLTPGVRAEYNRSSVFSAEGKDTLTSIYPGNPDKTNWLYNAFVQLGYHTSSAFSFDLKLARGMRAPTLKEAYALYLYNQVDGYDYVGNPAIRTEKSFNGELNFSYKRKNFDAVIRGFSYFFRDYIAGFVQPGLMPMTIGANGVKQFGNIPSAYIAGASLLFNWNLTPKVSFSSNTTCQSGKDKNENYLPMISPLKSINTLRYSANHWHFFAEAVSAATQNKVSSFYGETRTPGFSIMNAGVDKIIALQGQQLILSLTCDNISNQYYYEHLNVIKLPEEGRNFIMHVTYNF